MISKNWEFRLEINKVIFVVKIKWGIDSIKSNFLIQVFDF